MKFWIYEDVHGWGETMRTAAEKHGHEVEYFDDPRQPRDGLVFWHMYHRPEVRIAHKRAMAMMALEPSLTLVPTYPASKLFDDKLEQAREFSGWVPRSNVFFTPKAARSWLEEMGAPYPFMSKSAEGANGHNVRKIGQYSEANEEIRMAFSDRGIRMQHNMSQRGYLFWQQFIEHTHDYRIISVGSRRLVLKRLNKDQPMPAGQATRLKPIRMLDEEAHSALAYANKFFDKFKLGTWGGVDLISDGKRWYVLEFTVSWNVQHFADCSWFPWDAQPGHTGLVRDGRVATGRQIWDVFMEEVERNTLLRAA